MGDLYANMDTYIPQSSLQGLYRSALSAGNPKNKSMELMTPHNLQPAVVVTRLATIVLHPGHDSGADRKSRRKKSMKKYIATPRSRKSRVLGGTLEGTPALLTLYDPYTEL